MENVNVVLNLGLVTKNFIPLNKDMVYKIIASSTDATITECTGVYHGNLEPSLKIEIYDTTLENAVNLAIKFARTFNQECVAVTYKWTTVFVDAMATMEERKQLVKRLAKGE